MTAYSSCPPGKNITSGLGKTTASGAAWMVGLGIAARGLPLLSQLILAKILAPEDFGVYGLALTIITLFGVFANFGIEQIFLQRHTRMYVWATQAFWLSFGLTLVVALAVAICAPFGAQLYHNEHIASLVWILALSLPLSGLVTVPQTRLKAMMKFKFLAVYTIAEQAGIQALIILLAFLGMGPKSFVIPIVAAGIVRCVVFWIVAPMRLRPLRASKGSKLLLRRGASMFGIGVLGACIGQGDFIILGLTASTAIVGAYYFAFRIVTQPLFLAENFINVLRSTLVAMHTDYARQCQAALKTAEALALVMVPLGFLQAAVAAPGLWLLFDSHWDAALPLIQILSIGLPLASVAWAARALLESRGQFTRSFLYQLISAPFFFLFVSLGAWLDSAEGVAMGVTTYYILHPLYFTFIVFQREGVRAERVFSCFLKPIFMAAAATGVAWGTASFPLFKEAYLAQIGIILGIGGSLYVLAARHFSPEIYLGIQEKFRGMILRTCDKGETRGVFQNDYTGRPPMRLRR